MYTMRSKRAVARAGPDAEVKKELAYLYLRRTSIEALIRSLERYERFSPRPTEIKKRKTA